MESFIDIVCGGFYGDEGKGQICAWLAHKQILQGAPYNFAVRVGGSNAEHRFELPNGVRYTGRVLPVAGWVDPKIKLVLGAGHMIKLESLFREIKELESMYGKQRDRIFIDPQAGVIDPAHIEAGKEAATFRGSTHQGTGQAVAHKVVRDGKFKTARDYSELRNYVCEDTVMLMNTWMRKGEIGLLEGSQGAFLSLNHGYYPYCTSKDVTPAALLAEAGISTRRVRHIWAVFKAVPTRVPGNSGPADGRELSWEELEKAIGKQIPEDTKRQTDSGDRERIFLWSWKEFMKSINLIGPTHMALTFIDWWPTSLMGSLPDDLIKDMERLAGCSVNIVRNGPAWGDYYIPK
ncbi:MAG: adenylosuccinate synthetase [Candidatus Hodarchaeales archaeon]